MCSPSEAKNLLVVMIIEDVGMEHILRVMAYVEDYVPKLLEMKLVTWGGVILRAANSVRSENKGYLSTQPSQGFTV